MNLQEYGEYIHKRLAQPSPDYRSIASELMGALKMAEYYGDAGAKRVVLALHYEVTQAWNSSEEA